jgi:hypothetical protein
MLSWPGQLSNPESRMRRRSGITPTVEHRAEKTGSVEGGASRLNRVIGRLCNIRFLFYPINVISITLTPLYSVDIE